MRVLTNPESWDSTVTCELDNPLEFNINFPTQSKKMQEQIKNKLQELNSKGPCLSQILEEQSNIFLYLLIKVHVSLL